mmetsp:Transcript_1169/g.3275  ORF Transcript_1169/g.3275 Transcript_1169/m.3275 type:complete len:147 (-) Transcript_1169:195-635(-)
MSLLLCFGAVVNIPVIPPTGRSPLNDELPLHALATRARGSERAVEIAEMLVHAGAPLTAYRPQTTTPPGVILVPRTPLSGALFGVKCAWETDDELSLRRYRTASLFIDRGADVRADEADLLGPDAWCDLPTEARVAELRERYPGAG